MDRDARYVLSLSRARYLWDMTFFSSLVISAYLLEMMSMHPGQSYRQDSRLVEAFRLEYCVPAECSRPSCGHNRTIRSAFKQDRLRAWTSAVCECAQRMRIFRWEANEKVV